MESSNYSHLKSLENAIDGLVNSNAATGCSIFFDPSKSDMCNGQLCYQNWNCASGCCWGNQCRSDCTAYNLMWLWWTLSFLFLFCCICSMMAAARRRRRMMALAAIQRRNQLDHCDVVVVQEHNPNYAMGQPQPAYQAMPVDPNNPAMYGGYQQPVMYGQ